MVEPRGSRVAAASPVMPSTTRLDFRLDFSKSATCLGLFPRFKDPDTERLYWADYHLQSYDTVRTAWWAMFVFGSIAALDCFFRSKEPYSACIDGVVALFGALLLLSLRSGRVKDAVKSRVGRPIVFFGAVICMFGYTLP